MSLKEYRLELDGDDDVDVVKNAFLVADGRVKAFAIGWNAQRSARLWYNFMVTTILLSSSL